MMLEVEELINIVTGTWLCEQPVVAQWDKTVTLAG